MFGRFIARTVVALLKDARLSNEDRQLLTTAVIDRLGALPMRARIIEDEMGIIYVDGKQLTLQAAQKISETAKAMLNNFARKFVREQVVWMAIQKGVHSNTTPEEGLFAKAALYFYQEEDALYRKLAGVELDEDE